MDGGGGLVSKSTLATPRTVAHQSSLSKEFSRQEYGSGLPCPSPGDLPNPAIEPGSSALQTDFSFYRLSHQGSPYKWIFGPVPVFCYSFLCSSDTHSWGSPARSLLAQSLILSLNFSSSAWHWSTIFLSFLHTLLSRWSHPASQLKIPPMCQWLLNLYLRPISSLHSRLVCLTLFGCLRGISNLRTHPNEIPDFIAHFSQEFPHRSE